MWLKYPITVLLFLFLAILQASFLPRLGLLAPFLNLVFVVFFVACFFEEKNQGYQGIFFAIIAGTFLDIFSPFAFGFSIISLLLVYGAMKLAMYFITQTKDAYLLLRFIPVFLGALLFYNVLMHMFANFPHIGFALNTSLIMRLLGNLLFAVIAYLIYIKFIKTPNRQLTLL